MQAVEKCRSSFDKAQDEREEIEISGGLPFVLRLSKHEGLFNDLNGLNDLNVLNSVF